METRFTTTIFHDGQFWVAVVEREDETGYAVARHVFGPEPSGPDLLRWAASTVGRLRFTGALQANEPARPSNPKRRKREAAKAMAARSVSTRAEDAMRIAHEQDRKHARATSAARRAEARDRQHALKKRKRRARRKGH